MVTGTGEHSLNIGINEIVITVKAEDSSEKRYTLSVTRKDINPSDAFLDSLSVEGALLDPIFQKDTLNYSVVLPSGHSGNITILATTPDSSATITGASEYTIPLEGKNIEIKVTSGDQTSSKSYWIYFSFEGQLSSDTSLKTLTVDGEPIKDFNPEVFNYSIIVPNTVTEIEINAEASSSKASVTGTGKQQLSAPGDYKFDITVTAESGKTALYSIAVTKETPIDPSKSGDNSLKSLSVDGIDIGVFNSATKEYSATVPYVTAEITINAEANDIKAKIEGIGTFPLTDNESLFTIKVTAENGKIDLYTVKITKEAEVVVKSSDANLKSIDVSPGTLTPQFNPDIKNYTVTVDNSVSNIEILAVPSHSGASIQGSSNIPLKIGSNKTEIKVISEDLSTENIYTIEILRSFQGIVTAVGYEKDGNNNSIASVWDGSRAKSSLEYNSVESSATSSFTENNKIYIGGYVKTSGSTVACYWTDGVRTNLESTSYDSKVTDIFVLNGTVYASGYIQTGTNRKTACYWVNGSRTDLADYAAATGISVKHNSVAVAGYTINGEITVTCYWLDGTITFLADSTYISETSGITFGNDSELYISGYTQNFNSYTVACYWRNSARTDLGNNTYSSKATGITYNGVSVYASGFYQQNNNNSIACYWVNSNNNINRTDLGNNSADSAATSVIYINSTLYISGYTGNGNRIGCYWFNDTRVDLGNNGYNSVINDLVYN